MTSTQNQKSKVLLESLLKFFETPLHLHQFTLFTSNKSPLSLRLLDWLVTNYSKKLNIVYVNHHAAFNMFMNYKQQLKAYSKKYFDPFCRKHRLSHSRDRDIVCIGNAMGVNQETTVGQLNFFRWAIKERVLEYCLKYKTEIEHDMLNVYRQRRVKEKRQELSQAAVKACTKTYCPVVLNFSPK